jgi:hypothetical protein
MAKKKIIFWKYLPVGKEYPDTVTLQYTVGKKGGSPLVVAGLLRKVDSLQTHCIQYA